MISIKANILVIDDTPLNLVLFEAALARDFTVRTATSGLMGLAMAGQLRPDLILLDVMMPGMDGYETFRRLKDAPLLCDIPVVFVTGLADAGSEIKGLAMGAADYITKPINVDIARRRICNLLERERLHKEVIAQKTVMQLQIVELQAMQVELQASEESFRSLIEWSPTAIVVHRLGTLLYVNPSAISLVGAQCANDLLGRSVMDLIHPDSHQVVIDRMKAGAADNVAVPMMEEKFVKFDGTVIDVEVMATPVVFEGEPATRVAMRDVTAIKAHQSRLEHIAHFDALTNLPNRVLLGDRLRQALAQAQRRSQLLAVAYLDLDGFKAVNDMYGHDAGDQLLVILSARMKQALREGDTLARLGGDEFVAVLAELTHVSDSVPMLSRLLAAAAQPVQFGSMTLQVSASLGVAFFPQPEDVGADQLMRQADQAMYQAKLAGKNRYHVFDAEQDRSVRGHHESLDHIRLALAAREFVLHYQPKVDMGSGHVIGAEALIRWQHPERGLLPPAVFLPVIEDHPLAVEVGEWVIETALTQLDVWHSLGLYIPVSVNVGARQLLQADFVDRLRGILAAHPAVKPGQLELELLETSALEDVAGAFGVIEACRSLGVKFALDDFGTGYSSLTYLKRLPVTMLKIDQSFVRDMLDDPDDLAILQGVIGLAAAFKREVIAEGVETVAHGTLLLQLGCKLAQGYGIARPMPGHEMPDWATLWRPDSAWTKALDIHGIENAALA